MKVKDLKFNPNNPRRISPFQMDKLKKSIADFPEMMRLRPMVYDPATMVVLGGNQRLAAIRALGMKEIPDEWAIAADKLTDKQKKEFVLKDNVPLGEWDFEVLTTEFDEFNLDEMGIELPAVESVEEEHEGYRGYEDYGNSGATPEAYTPILRPSVSVGEITDRDIRNAKTGVVIADQKRYITHVCPSCGHEFTEDVFE